MDPVAGGAQRRLPSAAVIVCTRNRPEHLRACLAALQRLDYPGVDVLVVDNAPSDDAAARVAREQGARYVLEPRPGLSRARNRGIQETTAELLAFLDDDALPAPDWLRALAHEFDDPRVMAAGGRVVPVQDQPASERAGLLRGSYRGDEKPRRVSRELSDWFAQANFGALGIGTNMAFRRAALSFWKGFDERLGRGTPLDVGEDTYAFSEIVSRGYVVVYTPHAVVEHPFLPSPEDVVARRLRSRSAMVAYMMFLLVEEPAASGQVLGYVFDRITGRPIPWRQSVALPQQDVIPWWRSALALLGGPLLYFRQVFGGR